MFEAIREIPKGFSNGFCIRRYLKGSSLDVHPNFVDG